MDKSVLEQEAKKLFGGATIDVRPFQDEVTRAWDITIIPFIDKEKRFIRIATNQGISPVMNYLGKIQQHLLGLNHKGVFGINPIQIPVDESRIGEEIEKRLPKNATKATYACTNCTKKFKYPGPLAMHEKSHKKLASSVAGVANEPLIYEVKEE